MAQQYDEYGNMTDGSDSQSYLDPNADKRSSLNQWYQQYLGRTGSDSEYQSHFGNPNFGTVENLIRNSPEAKAYAAKSAPPAPSSAAQWNREAFRDQWMSTGTDVGRQNALLQQYGLKPDAAGRTLLPSGEVMDLDFGAKAGINRAQWTGVPGGELKTGQAPGGGGGFVAPSGFGTNPEASPVNSANGAPSVGTAPTGTFDPKLQALFDQLLSRAQQGTAIDRNDPTIRAQADSYAANEERARRNYLGDLAEQAGPLANLRGEQRVTAEQLGHNTGAFEAELVARELTSRRAEIADALHSMQGLLTQEQQFTLTKELANLDDAIKQQQLGLQGRQMDLQNNQFFSNLGLQGRQLDMQGQQFGQQLAYNYESLDQQLLRQLLSSVGV
jgi:hypothetical protein